MYTDKDSNQISDTKNLLYFYMLLNPSGEINLQFLTFTSSLLLGSTGQVLLLQMAFFLTSDHPGGGFSNEELGCYFTF